MSAHARKLARPTKRAKLPTADMSPGKAEERIKKYVQPVSDPHEVARKAAGHLFQFAAVFGLALLGVMPETPSAEPAE